MLFLPSESATVSGLQAALNASFWTEDGLHSSFVDQLFGIGFPSFFFPSAGRGGKDVNGTDSIIDFECEVYRWTCTLTLCT